MPELLDLSRGMIAQPLLERGLRILLVLIVAFILYRVAGNIFYRVVQRSQQGGGLDREERRKRANTLASLARATLRVLILVVASLMILRQLGYSMVSLVGASFVGVALGFGSQHLVKDMINGFFILLENQYRVGDEVEINGISGTVEDVSLRSTTLRDINGNAHVISNGIIESSANMTKGTGQVLIDLKVPHDEDLDRVHGALKKAGNDLLENEDLRPYVLDEPTVLGIVELEETGVTVRVICKTEAAWKWVIARELRRYIKSRFGAEGISLPSSRQSIR
jgi:small-conductance mechanosensitive channel